MFITDQTLVGDVNLAGNLVMDGATLYARPGVTVDGNGHEIVFQNGATADWQGTETFTWSLNPNDDPAVIGDETIQNRTRDIVFTDLGRIMFHEGAGPSTIRYVAITDSGEFLNEGFYCLHFHLNGPTTAGTLVEGVVVQGCENHAFVPHGSDGITFRDTIAFDVVNDAYWWDPGQLENDSDNIVFDHALADTVTASRLVDPDSGVNGFHRISAFALRGGQGNVVVDSAAVNVKAGSDCSGFHWPEPAGPDGLEVPPLDGVWLFEDNFSVSDNCHGIFVWQNNNRPHVIDGFSGNRIEHGAYNNTYQYRNLDVDEVVVHAISRADSPPQSWSGGSIGTVILEGHNQPGHPVVFENIAVGSVVNDSDKEPATIIFDNTGLTCGDVTGAGLDTVLVDGQEC